MTKISWCQLQFCFAALLSPGLSHAVCEQVEFPLSTEQQYIEDANGCTVVLKSVNWFGGESEAYVPGGLDRQPVAQIIRTVKEGGFNSVRLPWSNEMVEKNPVVSPRLLAEKPQMQSRTGVWRPAGLVAQLTGDGCDVVRNSKQNFYTTTWNFSYEWSLHFIRPAGNGLIGHAPRAGRC